MCCVEFIIIHFILTIPTYPANILAFSLSNNEKFKNSKVFPSLCLRCRDVKWTTAFNHDEPNPSSAPRVQQSTKILRVITEKRVKKMGSFKLNQRIWSWYNYSVTSDDLTKTSNSVLTSDADELASLFLWYLNLTPFNPALRETAVGFT